MGGPPASGKTYLARRVAEIAGAPLIGIDLGAGSDGFRVAGVSKGWGTAMPGRTVEEVLATGIGNVVAFIDEVDKGGAVQSTGGTTTSA